MVKLSDIKNALQSPTSSTATEVLMRELQDKIRGAATGPARILEDVTKALATRSNIYQSASLNIGPNLSAMDGVIKAQQARVQRERDTHDHTVKQTALLEQSQELQERFVAIMSDQARLLEGMLLEAKNTTSYTKLTIYFAALGATLGLLALLLK